MIRKQNEVIYRYTPHTVWKEIAEQVKKGGGELHNAEFNGTFLFLDVKGFTTYSEEHPSKKVVEVLNQIFDPATQIIYKYNGDVDKYMGDCIFAAFKTPCDAIQAGRDILVLFREIKKKGHPFSVRIGINSGRAVRANVGSKERREYTYIGDAVNLAQRLESNCTPGMLLIADSACKATAVDLGKKTRRKIMVKGKRKAVVAYECCP